MSAGGVEVIGLESVLAGLNREVERIQKEANNAVNKAGHAYQRDVQFGAPVDIGQYRASIRVQPTSGAYHDLGNPYVRVGTDKPQACRLEFGFWGMHDRLGRLFYQYQRPHFRPPLDTQALKYVAIIKGTLEAGMFENYGTMKRAEWSAMESGMSGVRPDLLSAVL